MGKFFGLLAGIGTAGLVSGCLALPNGASALSKFRAGIQQEEVERKEMVSNFEEQAKILSENLAENATCRKKEEDQKISEAAELNAVSAALVAEEQDTTHVECDGKETNVGVIVYPTEGSVVVTGPQVAKVITSVEVESDRT